MSHNGLLTPQQVNIDLNTHDMHSIANLKVENLGSAEQLTWRSILEYWPDQLPTTHLHVIMKIPATGE